MRVVSLLPSATEIVCALGVDPVGVSHECDYPPRVRDVPRVVHATIDTEGSSRTVDDRVREAVRDGGVYDLDGELLRDLDPDVVVTQGLCDVCAVDEAVVRETVDDLVPDAALVATHPHSLADLFDDIERIGRAIDCEREAARLVADLRERVERVRTRTATDEPPTVTVLDWLDPPMVSGHWMPELVDVAGGEYRLADPGVPSGPIEWATLREADPDVLVAAPCGFSLDRAIDAVDELAGRTGWTDLRAVREGRVVAMDGTHYVNRPGPRLVDTVEHLAGVLHPDRFGDPPDAVARTIASTTGTTS